VVPTLAGDVALTECLRSLDAQSFRQFEVIVVDNSGSGAARGLLPEGSSARIIENRCNAGFGGAVNQGVAASSGEFVATLNDDAVACPGWLEALVRLMDARSDVGLCASKVCLEGGASLDSAGMLLCADGSSTQRGHGEDAARFGKDEEVLLPSGSAAIYRRRMLETVGAFDADFFLYCEDTDLGLRALRAGWRCFYAADAVVEHRYSHSAGRASALKAYYVERNRLWVVLKNFPLQLLVQAPFVTIARYFWHLAFLVQGRGKAAQFTSGGGGGMQLAWFALKAHCALLTAMPQLIAKRRVIHRHGRMGVDEFIRTVRRHSVGVKQVAAH
jgi:GT2 family glycosyltransferase